MFLDFSKFVFDYLHIEDMDGKKKEDNETKESKFLVPFSSNTPTTSGLSSAAILTPPSTGGLECDSTEKAVKIPCFPRNTERIPFNLSFEADELDQEYRIDILKALQESEMKYTVIKHMLKFLDDLSLFRASHVSRTWRNMICGADGIEKERLNNFICRKKHHSESQGKENIGIQKRQRDLAKSILENTPKSPAKIFKPSTDLIKYRPCPRCNSPAMINKNETATCEQCEEDFCFHCFRQMGGHKLEQCIKSCTPTTTKTKKIKSRSQMIGSKQSKSRLRRLSKNSKK